jgi:diguanylate cyclase (GGDEF)-like protein
LYTDALTGSPNNEAFNVALTDSIERADRGEVPHPAVFFIDLDNFKQANDTLGHEQVDQMLIEIASEFAHEITVRSIVSSSGEELHEMFARKSGDEFVAFMYPVNYTNDRRDVHMSPEDMIYKFTGRIDKLVKEIADRHNAPFVGVSVGHVIHELGESLEKVRQRADVEMYKVKNLKKENEKRVDESQDK